MLSYLGNIFDRELVVYKTFCSQYDMLTFNTALLLMYIAFFVILTANTMLPMAVKDDTFYY